MNDIPTCSAHQALSPLLRIVFFYHTACEGHRRSFLELAEEEAQEPFSLHSDSCEPGQRPLTFRIAEAEAVKCSLEQSVVIQV